MEKTFKTIELPHTIYVTFSNDDEIYDGELIEIIDVDENNDKCILLADGLTPQRCRLRVPYSSLENSILDFGTGMKLYLEYPENGNIIKRHTQRQ